MNLEQNDLENLPNGMKNMQNLREFNIRLNDFKIDEELKIKLKSNGCYVLEGKQIFRKNQIKMNFYKYH